MNILFILQILHFYFFALLVLLFAFSAQFSYGFWALAHSSFNIFQKYQLIIKAGRNALILRYGTCMYANLKNSGAYGDFGIFCLTVGHREVKNFRKTHFDLRLCHIVCC